MIDLEDRFRDERAEPSFFAHVARMGALPALAIFAAMVIVPAIVGTSMTKATLAGLLEKFAKAYDENMPPLRIADGRASVDGEQPAIFPKPGSKQEAEMKGEFVVIYDTTGATEKLPEGCKAGVLVTADTVLVQQPDGRRQEMPIAQIEKVIGPATIDGAFIEKNGGKWLSIAGYAIGTLAFLYHLVAKSIAVLILAGAAFLNKRGTQGIAAGKAWKIAVVALAPAAAARLFLEVAGLAFPFCGMLLLVGAVALAAYGGGRAAEEEKPADTESVHPREELEAVH